MKRVVLIDDDVDDAGLFREALKRGVPAASLQHFNGSDDAVERLMEQADPLPDIVFLDINMPKVNGWQCLAKFKKEERLMNVPVVMYTTSSEAREIEMAKELGANGFITKPDSFNQLKEILTEIFATPADQLAHTLQNITARA